MTFILQVQVGTKLHQHKYCLGDADFFSSLGTDNPPNDLFEKQSMSTKKVQHGNMVA